MDKRGINQYVRVINYEKEIYQLTCLVSATKLLFFFLRNFCKVFVFRCQNVIKLSLHQYSRRRGILLSQGSSPHKLLYPLADFSTNFRYPYQTDTMTGKCSIFDQLRFSWALGSDL